MCIMIFSLPSSLIFSWLQHWLVQLAWLVLASNKMLWPRLKVVVISVLILRIVSEKLSLKIVNKTTEQRPPGWDNRAGVTDLFAPACDSDTSLWCERKSCSVNTRIRIANCDVIFRLQMCGMVLFGDPEWHGHCQAVMWLWGKPRILHKALGLPAPFLCVDSKNL